MRHKKKQLGLRRNDNGVAEPLSSVQEVRLARGVCLLAADKITYRYEDKIPQVGELDTTHSRLWTPAQHIPQSL